MHRLCPLDDIYVTSMLTIEANAKLFFRSSGF